MLKIRKNSYVYKIFHRFSVKKFLGRGNVILFKLSLLHWANILLLYCGVFFNLYSQLAIDSE